MKDYYVMSGDTIVAKWEKGELTVLDETLLPLYLKRVHNADMWLQTRAIDSHRTNSRLLKKALRLKEKNDLSTVIHVNGATITDNYWIKEFSSSLCYDDIKFTDDYFHKLALKGSYKAFDRAMKRPNTRTPELTNIGSFEKCWRLIDGKWWLIKSANQKERFSEMFIYKFGEALGMNMAIYETAKDSIKSLDFTDGASVNFEPASAFMGDNEDYEDVFSKLQEICPQAIPDYVRMLFLDTIVVNPDRHTENFGLLRDIHTGELLGLAPLFDHNLALISLEEPKIRKTLDGLMALFCDFISNHNEFLDSIPGVTPEIIRTTIENLHMRVKKQYIIDLIMSRYNLTVGSIKPLF